jgi:hypothetical protein
MDKSNNYRITTIPNPVIVDVIVASAGEADYGAGFIAAQHAINARIIAEELGHPQPATLILCDNSFARNLATDSCY